ncbi:MAG: hypothetical protein GTN95_00110, partial [Gammaproteobacteria bacterium]|nr:hypothetical protein [Gammaproteobacteria bacterium]
GNADGTFDTTITITVENLGDSDIQNLQVTDDVDAAFPGGTSFTIASG